MPQENPFANPPHFPPPHGGSNGSGSQLHIRTNSRSPVRHHARGLDPLLRDLSPTTTLRACSKDPDDMDMDPTSPDALIRSIRSASISQRALGAKAASVCLDFRTWTREIEAWRWPGTFDIPEEAREKARLGSIGSHWKTSSHVTEESAGAAAETDEYWGSLPARTVRAYEKRADEISQRLDEMDVEELKDYVLNSHYRVNSRPPSRTDNFSDYGTATVDMKKLDDFTALVTATILQALPFLSRLHRLLDIWTIRLIILRSAPNYLRDLKRARNELDHGWAVLAASPTHSSDTSTFDRHTMEKLKATIQSQVGSLGRRLDRFLDDLEGRSDCVPDTWVNDFELLESAYGTWAAQAERRMLEHEWHKLKRQSGSELGRKAASASIHNRSGLLAVSETENPDSDDDAVRRPSQDVQSRDQSPWLAPDRWSAFDTFDAREAEISRAKEIQDLKASMSSSALPSRSVSQPIPVVIAPDAPNEDEIAVTTAASYRSASGGSSIIEGEPGRGQLAKKRAAFLNAGIEQNERLNTSKSPVRPFEHASNAFTRLFKKERSPEQMKPKRTPSNRWRPGAPAEPLSIGDRKALSPVSPASSPFNSISGTSSIRSEASSSKSSINNGDETMDQNRSDADLTQSSGKSTEHHQSDSQAAQELRVTVTAHRTRDSTVPETYRPTGLHSPFHSPSKAAFPEDWPLTPPAATETSVSVPKNEGSNSELSHATAEECTETKTPTAPIETDVFDRMFVQSLPQPSSNRPTSVGEPERSRWSISRKRPASLPRSHRPPVPAREYLDMVSTRKPRAASSSRPKTAPNGSTVTHIETAFPLPDFALLSASQKRYSRPKSAHMDASKPELPTIDVDVESLHEAFQVKRASVASIEQFSRADLKSIDVPKSRHNSISPRITPPQTPPATSRQSSLEAVPTVKPSDTKEVTNSYFPTSSAGQYSSVQGQDFDFNEHGGLSATPEIEDDAVTNAPLNAAMRKRRVQDTRADKNVAPASPRSPSRRAALRPDADNFDRHVSDVLETLPAPIKFKPRLGSETPVPRSSGFGGPRPRSSLMKVPNRNGDLTIVPAESSPKKSSSSSEPEVKLYHLTQNGRDDPIKLFVRIVGEGEQRVMVRVGGGWTDLADYLIGFAQHHGSRTVSEGNLEVQTVTGATRPRKASGPAEFNRAKSPATPLSTILRPDSSGSDSQYHKPPPAPLEARTNGGAVTPKKASNEGQSSTPKSTSSGSRPSTANLSRPPSRQNTGEVGLSGPSSASKRAGLPEHKAKWVDGMIERAKQASAEKSKEDRERFFNEIGKVGGTRRLYFRSTSGANGNVEKTK